MPEGSIYHRFVAAAMQRPDAVAIADDGRELTSKELVAASRAAARGLMARGLEKGDRVGIWSVNRIEWIVAALAIQAAGGVLVPLSTRLRASEIGGILRRVRAKMVICDRSFGNYDFVAALASQDLPDLNLVICFDAADPPVLAWEQLPQDTGGVDEMALDARLACIAAEDLVDILFTSGTTGQPKGVPMTHAQSFIACERQQLDFCHFAAGETFCVVFPFAHNAGYRAGWQVSLLYGVRIVPVRLYDPLALLTLFQNEKPAYLPAAPPIFRAMLDHPRRGEFDLSSVRIAITGGTDVPVKLIEEMVRDLGVQAVLTGYGLTEAAGSVTSTRVGDPPEIVAFTAGTRLSNLDVKCVDAAGQEVPAGTAGEILVRGPQVLSGYFEDPKATKESFTEDGFFRTGDIGKFDGAGNLAITGRLKEMYLVGGFNCYPAEIEQMLRQLEGVADAAVVGVPDERLGEVGWAYLVLKPGSLLCEADVVAWSRDNMANYKVPRRVVFLQELPRNPQGKVLKTALRS